MNFFVSLLCVCLGAYLGLKMGVQIYAHFFRNFFLHHKESVEATGAYLVLLAGMGILSSLSFVPPYVVVLLGFAGLGILAFCHSQISKKWQVLFQILLCLCSFLALYQFSFDKFIFAFLLVFLWWLMWRTIVWFDHFPLTSLIVFFGWTMGVIATGLLMHTFPSTIVGMVALLGTVTLVLSSFCISQKQPIFGKQISSLLGFIWAGVWAYCLTLGGVTQTIMAYGYYLFEFVFLILAFLYHRPMQTFLERLLAYPQFASKAAGIVLSHVLLLSFLATTTIHMSVSIIPLLIFAFIAVLLDLYLRLNAFENPLPSWRELFKNTAEGVKLFANQVKQARSIKKAVDSPKKTVKKMGKKTGASKKVSPKKPKRKTVKKKVVHKK